MQNRVNDNMNSFNYHYVQGTRFHTPTLTGVLGRNSWGTEASALSRRDTKEFADCLGSLGYALNPGFS